MDSKTKAKLGNAKVKAGNRAKLNVRVTSPFVSNVTGKVLVKVSGQKKKITERLTAMDKGKAKIQLPKLKSGKYSVKREVRRLQHRQALEGQPVEAHCEVIAAAASTATPPVRA